MPSLSRCQKATVPCVSPIALPDKVVLFLQLWEQLKSDADAAYRDASELLNQSEHAAEAAAAAEAKLGDAKK